MIIIQKNSINFYKTIPLYGILFILGFLFTVLIAFINNKNKLLDKWEIIYASIFMGIGGIIGAKLLSIITSLKFIIEHNLSFQDIIKNGFVFYGGLIGGYLGLLIYCKAYKLDFFKYADLISVGIPLGHSFGRLGCLLSGCCYGKATNNAFSVIYTNSLDINTPLNVPLIPIQLIESICLIFIFIAIEIIFITNKKKSIPTITYLILYSISRFILEFFRGDKERGIFYLSTSQYISLIILFTIVISVIYIKFKKAKKYQPQ